MTRLSMALAVVMQLRAEPIANCPGHEILGPDLAQLVATEDRYAIVEKIGVSAEVTEELDPRADDSEQRAAS
jgi:hypothetical protein